MIEVIEGYNYVGRLKYTHTHIDFYYDFYYRTENGVTSFRFRDLYTMKPLGDEPNTGILNFTCND